MHEFRAKTQNFSPAIIELDGAIGPAGCAKMAIRCMNVRRQCGREG